MAATELTLVALTDITLRDVNEKTHPEWQIAEIAARIDRFGMLDPVELDIDGRLLVGEGRYHAAAFLGHTHIPAIRLDISGPEADLYAVMHNHTTLTTPVDPRRAVASLDDFGLVLDEARLSGLTDAELQSYSAGSEVMQSPDPVMVEPVATVTRQARRVVLRFETEGQRAVWQRFVISMRAAMPEEPDDATRLLRYIRGADTLL